MNRSFVMLTVAVAVAGTAVAGCSPGASTPPASGDASSTAPGNAVSASPASFIAQAASTTESTGSARITSTTTAEGGGASGSSGGAVNVRVDGVVDFAADKASLRMSSALFGGDTEMQVIVADGTSYVQLPMFGQKWIKMPIQQLGVDFADPTTGLEMLRRTADLTEVGPEPVDGVEATKYTGTIDLKKALEEMSTGDTGVDEKMGKQLARTTGNADITVWVDSEGRIVRYDQKATIEAGGQAITTTTSTTLTDFGVATDITPPPSDEVMDKSALDQLGDLAGQAG